MTFSLRPCSVSVLPAIAASVRTLGGFLEGCGRDERRRLQRCLGDAEKDRIAVCGLLAFFDQAVVVVIELDAVDVVTHDVVAVARVSDLNLLQHLANDHLDVLVVDHNALQSVDFLDFVDQVRGECLDALDRQDVVRSRVTVEDVITLFDVVAFLKVEGLPLRDQVFDRLDTVFCRLDDDATLVLVVAAEADRTIDLSDDGVVLRTTGFEQFGNARQTTGDVLGLGAFQRRTCKHVTLGNLLTRLDRQDRFDGQVEAGFATTCNLQNVSARILDDDRRLQSRHRVASNANR